MLGVLAVLAAGCPEPSTPVDDGSSTGGSGDGSGTSSGPDGSSTLTGSSSESEGPDDSGTTTTASSSSTSDDDSTTGSSSRGQARFVVREPIPGTDAYDLVLYEYADGELTPPQSITPDLPAGGGMAWLSGT